MEKKAKLNFILIGERIKNSRKAAGMTQRDLADLVNLSEGSVSKYEHGKVEDASTAKLSEFAKALKVDLVWLLGLGNENEIRPSFIIDGRIISALQNNSVLCDFLLKIVNLDEEQQEEIIATGLFLVSQRNKQRQGM
jgi:transcriptional regulator with XRE-family HTH domain